MERLIDSRTAKFVWDPIYADQLTDPNSGIRGRLTGFLVISQKKVARFFERI